MSGNADTIKEFLVGLGFNVDEAGLKSFQGAIGAASAQAAVLATAVVAASGAVFAMVQHVAAEYFELDKLAMRLRSTAEAIDAFRDAGTILGITDEQTIGSLKSLDKAIGDTALGVGRAKKVFEAIGQVVVDAQGKMRPTTVVMQELAEKFQHMERGRALAIMERLGLDPALLRLFNTDLAALGEEITAIERAAGFDLGVAIAESKAFTDSWRAFTQELEKWKMLFGKMVDVVAVQLMPRFRATLDRLGRSLVEFRQMVMGNMGTIKGVVGTSVNALLRVVEVVSLSAYRLIQVVSYIVGGIIRFLNQLDGPQQAVVLGIVAIAAAWRYLNVAFFATPLGMALALAAAIGLLVDDFLVWKEGGDSLIDWAAWEPGINAAILGITALKDAVVGSLSVMLSMIVMFVQFLTGDFAGGWATAAKAGQGIIDVFMAIGTAIVQLGIAFAEWTGLASVFSAAWGRVGAVIQVLSDGLAAFQRGFGGALPALQNAFGLTPAPRDAAALSGGQSSVNQTTEIIVQGASNPDATARSVAAQQNRVNADMARNTRGVMR